MSAPAFGEYSASYQQYLTQAKGAIERKDFNNAFFYVEAAHLIDPNKEEPIELIKRIPVYGGFFMPAETYVRSGFQALAMDNFRTARFYFKAALRVDPDNEEITTLLKHIEQLLAGERSNLGIDPVQLSSYRQFEVERKEAQGEKRKVQEQLKIQARVKAKEALSERPVVPREIKTVASVITGQKKKSRSLAEKLPPQEMVMVAADQPEFAESLELNEDLWQRQPNMELSLEVGSAVILSGRNIQRYLIVSEGFIEIKRVDNDQVEVVARQRGRTFLHVWEDERRWTFHVNVIFPERKFVRSKDISKTIVEEHVENFIFHYSNNWNAFYLGDSFDELSRQDLDFRQTLGFHGPTPYGYFDASTSFFKFAESTEATEYTVGLNEGHFDNFKDFTLRGFDASKRFSDLTLPGRFFRGFLADSYAFDRMIQWTYLRGKDRTAFSSISPGVTQTRESWIEGAQLKIFPDSDNQYTINYATGFGEARDVNLKENVYSLEMRRKINDIDLHGEVAFDEEKFGRLIHTIYEKENHRLQFDLRDIEEGFTTITGKPTNRGEAGGIVDYAYKGEGFSFDSNLDLYRDREFANADNPDDLNIDIGASVAVPLTETLNYYSSAYYINTPQLISPRESFRINNNLSKTFRIYNNRKMSFLLGNSYATNRYDLSPSSEYDRLSVSAGVRIPLIDTLTYFINYEYSWVDEIASGDDFRPNVLNTGLNYSRKLTKKLTSRMSLTYRDEEDTEGHISFLGGEDSLRGNIGLTYRPKSDIEIFMDGALRNVWRENPDNDPFSEADVRFGVSTSWDTFVHWDPTGTVKGYVFKDLNRNGLKEQGEPGIAGIKIKVGNKEVITESDGYYRTKISATKVKVSLDEKSLPSGFVLSSLQDREVTIEHRRIQRISFGLIVHSGLYGIAFFDANGNNIFDQGEQTFANVEVKLEGKGKALTNHEGVYSFNDIAPGHYQLIISINSLPLEYLPKIRSTHEIDIEEGVTKEFHIPLKKK